MENPPFELRFKKTCFKVPYQSKKGAKRAMRRLLQEKHRKELDHVYYCEQCSQWHITSMDRVLANSIEKAKAKKKNVQMFVFPK